MVKVLILLVLFSTAFLFAGSITDTLLLNQIRTGYYLAIEDEDRLIEFEQLLTSLFLSSDSAPALIMGYFGGIEALKGKHAFNPFTKYKYVKSALEILQNAINKEPDNIEIRFIRFSILHYIPSILGYGGERSDDLFAIVTLLKQNKLALIDEQLKQGIINFIIDSKRLSKQQLAQLRLSNII